MVFPIVAVLAAVFATIAAIFVVRAAQAETPPPTTPPPVTPPPVTPPPVTPPPTETIDFQTPANGATINGLTKVVVTASNPANISAISVYLGSQLLKTETITPYEFPLDPSKFLAGDYSLDASASRLLGTPLTKRITVKLAPIVTPPPVTPPPPSPQPPGPPPSGSLDQYGIIKVYGDASPADNRVNPSYKFSTHSGGSRDTFWWENVNFMDMEVTGYFNIAASNPSDENSYKFYGGVHSSSNPKAGRCYMLAVEFSGLLNASKEYPQHPDGSYGIGSRVLTFIDPNFKSIGNSLNRWYGFKIAVFLRNNIPTMEAYIDPNPFSATQDKWKLWGKAQDTGQWEGAPYTTLQGQAAGDGNNFYMRIDTPTRKTQVYGLTLRKINHLQKLRAFAGQW